MNNNEAREKIEGGKYWKTMREEYEVTLTLPSPFKENKNIGQMNWKIIVLTVYNSNYN